MIARSCTSPESANAGEGMQSNKRADDPRLWVRLARGVAVGSPHKMNSSQALTGEGFKLKLATDHIQAHATHDGSQCPNGAGVAP